MMKKKEGKMLKKVKEYSKYISKKLMKGIRETEIRLKFE